MTAEAARYPYIIAYGKIMGSNEAYVREELALAARDNAPADAWSYSGGVSTDHGPRVWNTVSDLDKKDNPLADRLRRFAGEQP
jgi:hypothetical protein